MQEKVTRHRIRKDRIRVCNLLRSFFCVTLAEFPLSNLQFVFDHVVVK